MRNILTTTAAAAALAGGMAFAQSSESDMTIVETAAGNEDFSTLVEAVEAAGLDETLNGEGPFTVFAPTNAAFDEVDPETLNALLESPDELEPILTYHVVADEVMAGDLTDGQEIETVNGETLTVTIDGDTVMVGDATVTEADITASNGVIHAIDTVLMPSGM